MNPCRNGSNKRPRKMNLRILIVSILFGLLTHLSFSQSYSGYLADNYNGVHGVLLNPASISDSRLKLDINLAGFSAYFGNNYLGIDLGDAFQNIGNTFDIAEQTPLKDNFLAVNLDILGPSLMLSINKNNSLAIFSRGRFFFNLDDVNGSLLEKEGGFNEEEAFSIQEDNVSGAINLWSEIGATYSRVLMNQEQHFIKGGLTVKYLMGAHHAYIKGENINVAYDPNTDQVTTSGVITYGNDVSNSEETSIDFSKLNNSSGFGTDLGFIYEWRPAHAKFKSTNNDGKSLINKGANKYKLKLGLSVTDIGKINNKEGEQSIYDLNKIQDYANFEGIDLEDALQGNFDVEEELNSSAKTTLPTALHATVDWNIHSKFYLNFNSDISLASKKGPNTNHILNEFTLSPRLETKWIGVYSPFSIAQKIGLQWGVGFRAGPVYAGSGTILTTLLGQTTKSLDFYSGVKLPIYQGKQKDKDQDGLFDKLDDCPRIAGPVENNGCPWKDTDKDEVLDKDDPCPNEHGPIENNGCPWSDSDSDGLLDKDDTCPQVAGPKENNGCPWNDADQDSILDKDDQCPNEAGPKENGGCPWKDTDADGILDKDDDCPEILGLKQFNGCPDTDSDGIKDSDDRCPELPGRIENKGCPDADNDTLVDMDDECPIVAGPVSNNGCPEVTEEVQKQLNSYARTILFDTGKSTIKSESLSVMIDIIQILNEYPNAHFTVEGHTDSVGSSTSNQRLSEARANSVRDFLIKEKIDPLRLTAIGYGEERPMESNATKEGRKQNRRVEINLIK